MIRRRPGSDEVYLDDTLDETASGDDEGREALRQRIIGLGERSVRKSYYPQLRRRLSELERFRLLLDETRDSILMFAVPSGQIVDANRSACRQLGFHVDALRARRIDEVSGVSIDSALSSDGATRQTHFLPRMSEPIPVEVTVRIVSAEGEAFGVVVARDIRERLETETALRLSEARNRHLVTHAPVGILYVNAWGLLVEVNERGKALFAAGSEVAPGADVLANPRMQASGLRDELQRCLNEGGAGHFEGVYQRHDGERVALRANLVAGPGPDGRAGVLVVLEDVTEVRALEARLRQSEKMEAVGTLAGGIAHDFNNILGAIMGHAELTLLDLREDDPLHQNLDAILKASLRARDLVRRILTFSRQAEAKRETIRLSELVTECLGLLRPTFPAFIQLEVSLPSAEPPDDQVHADPTELHQIVTNLVTNASQAIEDGRGTVKVSVQRVETGPPEVGPGPWICLTVEDSGPGIEAHILARIFDPYFTTKAKGRGTGMGLAMVHGIVRRHDGQVTVDGRPGLGARFQVWLPVAPSTAMHSVSVSMAPITTGLGTVLLVDDEPALVELGRLTLERFGFKVIPCASGEAALNELNTHLSALDVLVADVTMPDITGDQLASVARSLDPALPVVLCTGFSERLDGERAQALGVRALLEKPLPMTRLVEVVSTLAAERRASRATLI